jgi:thiol-disulfide isomerase/thioredoxin/tetratricopeptide (TPR) repeat protein
MPFRRLLVVLLALLLVGHAAAGAQSARPVADPVVVGAAELPAADRENAIAHVRSLYFAHDFHHGAAEGDAALARWPESSELAMWTVANLVGPSVLRRGGPSILRGAVATAAEGALARAESLVAARPDDVWGAIALALALTHHSDRRGEALEASLRALELAPTLPEAVWVRGVVLHDRQLYRDVATLIEEKLRVVDRQWAELLILKGDAYLAMESEEPQRIAEAIEILARVREQDPENVNAHFLAGTALRRDRLRRDERAALLERAAALSPGSNAIASDHWRAIWEQPGLDAEEKTALILASAGGLLERRGQYPSFLASVAQGLFLLGHVYELEGLKAEGAAIEDRVLTESAHTEAADVVLFSRSMALNGRLEVGGRYGEVADTVAARAELSSMLWSFIDRPRDYRTARLGVAYMTLFDHSRRDLRVTPDTLLLLARGAKEHAGTFDPLPHARLARGLAERGVHLDAARQFARDGIDAAEEFVSRVFHDPAEAANALDRAFADVYAAAGFVELQAGDMAAAREATDRALALRPHDTQVQFQAGAMAEAEDDLATAEIHYAWGEREERLLPGGAKPNRDALVRIYMERHGSMEGYEEFTAAALERDRDRRWQRIADSRISEPGDLPAIGLEWLDGGSIGADELAGRIVVVNFWGVWCGPCVLEAPQIQQFHEKYRDDPGVVFLTVNAFDPDLEKVRTWMSQNGYDFPVLVDDNFATPNGVRGYPTTWFADADGRIIFSYSGVSAAVFEEFVWRVEMLQAEAGVRVEAGPPADLETAIARVRSLYFANDFHHGAAEGDAALERWPESSELLVWTIASLSRSRSTPPSSAYSTARAAEAVARAESLVTTRPDDVWGAIALALALAYHKDRRGEALAASLRPLELSPTMPEAVWARGFILHNAGQYGAVTALIEEKWPVVDRPWAELLALQADAFLAMRLHEGPERLAEGLEILARARQLDPENVNAHYLAGRAVLEGDNVVAYYLGATAVLESRRVNEAAALLDRAAALSPGATEIAAFRWRAIQADPGRDAEEKKALIRASAGALVELRGQYPGVLRSVAGHLGFFGLTVEAAELQDRVVAEFAHTVDAEAVLANRWERLAGRLSSGQVEDTASVGTELSSMLWSFIDRPRHHQPELLGNAYRRLFNQARHDEAVSPDTLLLLAHGAAEHNRSLPHAEMAIGLAERGAHLDAARKLAWDGIDAAEEHVSGRIESYKTPGDAADALDRALANVYSAIGYVELKAGDLVAGRASMNRALELKPDDPEVQFRAGALAEAEGDGEAAEIHYAWGERYERLRPGRDKPNRHALERIFTQRHGSMEGYEAFIAGIDERDRARRRQRIADSRIEEPRSLPAIDLEWLHGGRIGADELEGRIVVINFWGIWCGPCVAEAPQLQRFHEKYRDDPGVLFLTMDVFDSDLDKVRTWMADNRYDYPVLVDDDFATRHGIRIYPTTWFAGADGRIVFEYSGVSAAVFEEFVWRVEMLQADAAATAAAGAAQTRPEGDQPSTIPGVGLEAEVRQGIPVVAAAAGLPPRRGAHAMTSRSRSPAAPPPGAERELLSSIAA